LSTAGTATPPGGAVRLPVSILASGRAVGAGYQFCGLGVWISSCGARPFFRRSSGQLAV